MYDDERVDREAAAMPVIVSARSCILCCACRNVCEPRAVTIRSGAVRIDAERCTACGACIAACIPGALSLGDEPR